MLSSRRWGWSQPSSSSFRPVLRVLRKCLSPAVLTPRRERSTGCSGSLEWGQDNQGGWLSLSRKGAPPAKHGACVTSAAAKEGGTPTSEELATFNAELWNKLIPFLIPVSVVVLSEPLLALCTSIFVGTYSTTVELAAIGPSMIILNFIQYALYSLQVATLALTAAALRDDDTTAAQRVLSCAIFSAATWGAIMFCLVWFGAKILIAMTGVTDPAVAASAVEYLRVRAVGQPAVLMMMVMQGAMLAQQNSFIPGLIITSSTIVAILAQYVLVGKMGMGLVGTAISTSGTNVLAGIALLVAAEMKTKLKPRMMIPTAKDIDQFVQTVAPLSVTYISKNTCYMLINTTAASTLSVLPLAAHQAVYAIWGFSSFLISPIEQAALTFMPATRKRWEMFETGKVVMWLGTLIGALGGVFVCTAILQSPSWFTSDASLYPLMATVSGWTVLSLIFTGIDVAANGITIALGDTHYVARTLVFTMVCIFVYTSAARYFNWGLTGVWGGVTLFFFLRAARSAYRVAQEYMAGLDPPGGSSPMKQDLDLGPDLA